ncbi:MAG: squalene/phytoene synthase family protein [Ignavibacteria bacterium]|jgi:squalene synthase HpnC|nr:squalene/phytoene synthase family protein [Ignavibacteria bacterium]
MQDNTTYSIAEAYDFCKNIATAHYENFPVASLLLPKNIRKYFYAIYAFARTADDIADELTLTTDADTAAKELNAFRKQLQDVYNNEALFNPVFIALADTIHSKNIPIQPFESLLDAFYSDIFFQGIETLEQLHSYCELSANPVGELLLYLFGEHNEQNLLYSNDICTALQIINHLQDIEKDIARSRCYIPNDLLMNADMATAKKELIAIANGLMLNGRKLFPNIHNLRFKIELRLIWHGGMAALKKLK